EKARTEGTRLAWCSPWSFLTRQTSGLVLARKTSEPRRARRSCRPPDIPMVQTADPRKSNHLPELPRLDRARDRRVAVEAHVRVVLVVVAGVPADQAQEMTLTENDHVIAQLSTKGEVVPQRLDYARSPRLRPPGSRVNDGVTDDGGTVREGCLGS